MAQEVFTLNAEEGDNNIFLMVLTIIFLSFWVSVTVLASPQAPKLNDDRRAPLSDELSNPLREWREPEQPKQTWRTEDPLIKNKKKRGRFEDKRFKPYYYDPEKEGDDWDPYSRKGRDFDSKPATIFRFQF